PGASRFDADHAADQIEDDKDREQADDRNGADPTQRDLVEVAPIPAGGLLDHIGPGIGNRSAPLDSSEFLEELFLLHRAGRRVDRAVGVALLSAGGSRNGDDQRERHRTDDETDAADSHGVSSLLAVILRSLCTPASHDAIVSRYAVFQPQAPEP